MLLLDLALANDVQRNLVKQLLQVFNAHLKSLDCICCRFDI